MGGTSRMNREVQVRICERLGVKFPGPTRRRGATPRADSAEAGDRRPYADLTGNSEVIRKSPGSVPRNAQAFRILSPA